MPRKFEVRSARGSAVVAGLLFLLIGLVGLAGGGEHTAAYVASMAIGVVMMVRGYFSATVVVQADRIDLIGFARRRAVPMSDVRSAEVRVGTTGWGSFGRAYLGLMLNDGRSVEFKELNSRRPAGPSVVDDAVACINARLSSTQNPTP